jgi:hypothetical protein
VQGPNGRPQLRIDLELENVSDSASPIELAWANLGSDVELSLEGENGTVVPRSAVAGNEFSFPPYTLRIPVDSAVRITISPAAYEYVPAGAKLLRPLTFQAWDLSQASAAKLYLKGKVMPPKMANADRKLWVGPLELPRVELPSS